MHKIEIVSVATLLLTFILIIFAGFIVQRQQSALGKVAPTTVPFPTFTNTPSIQPAQKTPAAAQSLPHTATPLPPTATPRPPTVIVNTNINVRHGPGTNYGIIGGVNAGQEFVMIGIESAARQWIQIDYNGIAGWVYAPLVTALNSAGVQVAANIAPPPRPTNTPVPVIVQPPNTPVPTRPTQVVSGPRQVYDDRRIDCATERNRRIQERRDAERILHERNLENIQISYDRERQKARERYGHSFAQRNIRLAEIDRLQQEDIEDEQLRHKRRLEDIDRTAIVCD